MVYYFPYRIFFCSQGHFSKNHMKISKKTSLLSLYKKSSPKYHINLSFPVSHQYIFLHRDNIAEKSLFFCRFSSFLSLRTIFSCIETITANQIQNHSASATSRLTNTQTAHRPHTWPHKKSPGLSTWALRAEDGTWTHTRIHPQDP